MPSLTEREKLLRRLAQWSALLANTDDEDLTVMIAQIIHLYRKLRHTRYLTCERAPEERRHRSINTEAKRMLALPALDFYKEFRIT